MAPTLPDRSEACLLTLAQDGPMDIEGVAERSSAFKDGGVPDPSGDLESLMDQGMVSSDGDVWTVTGPGSEEARRLASERGVQRSPWMRRVGAMNATADIVLTLMLLSTGWFTGSVALLALAVDSALAATSDASSSLLRPRRSLGLMTVVTIGGSLLVFGYVVHGLLNGGFPPVTDRPLVIAVATLALLVSLMMRGLSRFTAERTGSIPSLSRGEYSKERAILALGIIVFTFLSMNDTPVLDPVFGSIVGACLLFNGLNTWAESRRIRDGRIVDISDFNSRLDRRYGSEGLLPYRSWVMHALGRSWMNKVTLTRSLTTAFPYARVPILVGREGPGIDLEAEFEGIVGPMLKTRLLVRTDDDRMSLTPVGRMYVRHSLRCRRYTG